MITEANLIRGYSKAIFATADHLKLNQEYLIILENLSNIVQLPKIKSFIKNNLIAHEDKAIFLIKLINEHIILNSNQDESNFNQKKIYYLTIFENFIKLLARKNHLLLITHIGWAYEKLYLMQTNTLKIRITSAVALDVSFQRSIKENLVKHFKKDLFLSYTVDQSIIAGLIIKYNDQVIDYSFKGKLLQLKNFLKDD